MPNLRSDPFFTAAQQERLMVLMARWAKRERPGRYATY